MEHSSNAFITLIQSKKQLAISGILLLMGGFITWKYRQEQYEKFLVQQQKECQQDFDIADNYVKSSKYLYTRYYFKNLSNKKHTPQLKQPGINVPFEPGESYILMYDYPAKLIPDKPHYSGQFFSRMIGEWKTTPPPLMVIADSLPLHSQQLGLAIVTSSCSPRPFTVPLKNLYKI